MNKDVLYPLRRLHGWLVEKKLEKQAERRFEETLRWTGNTGVMMLGVPTHTNLGDSAIAMAQIAFLQRCGVAQEQLREVTAQELLRFTKVLLRQANKAKLICWHGGGNMGNQWFYEEKLRWRVLLQSQKLTHLIFPQTIYYTADEEGHAAKQASIPIYNGCKKLTIVAREQVSYDVMNQLYCKAGVMLTPDIVLSASMETFGAAPQKRSGVLLCMRDDPERAMTDETRQMVEQAVTQRGETFRYTDMHAPCPVTRESRGDHVKAKLEELASARLVITDRLHGMVFSAITGTPCIAFGNYNHKVHGTYEWIKYLPYIRYVETAEEAESLLPEMLKMGGQVYDNTPLMPYFDELARVVKESANN